jgi:hypothetical protein
MSSTISSYAAVAQLAALKAALDGGNMYYFAGPIPASVDEALDMSSSHTQLVKMTNNNDGATGLNFVAPSGSALSRDTGQVWSGTIAFSGASSGSASLTASFWRFCPAGDDGRADATVPRLQGTIGASGSGADIELNASSAVLTAGPSNTTKLGSFSVSLTAI